MARAESATPSGPAPPVYYDSVESAASAAAGRQQQQQHADGGGDAMLMFSAALWIDYVRSREPTPRTNLTADIRQRLLDAATEQPHSPQLLARVPPDMSLSVYCEPRATCADGLVVRIGGGCPCCDELGGTRGVARLARVGSVAWLKPQLPVNSTAAQEFERDPYSHPESEFPHCGLAWVNDQEVELFFVVDPGEHVSFQQ